GKLPPVLDDLRDQLRSAAARDNEVEQRVAQRLRRVRRRHWLLIALGALVSFGGVAVAERALDRRGADQPADRIPPNAAPGADPGVVTSSATADPGGGPPWAVRVFTNRAGLDCAAVGRLIDGAIGTYDNARRFRALPADVSGACEPLATSGLLVAVQYHPSVPKRTVVYGLTRDRGPVRVTIAGVTRTVPSAGLGTFIDVREGVADMRGASVATRVGGRTTRRSLGPATGTSRTPR
ncbi:MAG TPA: hypothetical protein VEX67_09140, partial [Solirubrobacteraceae bacterium]|nr:hypothetical protein [Solirubrobacteraceae bacterium]